MKNRISKPVEAANSVKPVVSGMLLQKEAIDFVMWCKNNREFVYEYECNRHYNEILYAKFKSNYR